MPRVAEISNAKRRFDEIEAENVHILIQPSQIPNVKACLEGKEFYTAGKPESLFEFVEKHVSDVRQSLQAQIDEQQSRLDEQQSRLDEQQSRIDELQASNEKMNGKVDRVLSLLLDREESNSRLVLELGKLLKEGKQ